MKPMILVTAPVETRSGYGNHARDICRALIESDKYDVRIQGVRWGNTPPNALEKNNPIHNEIQKRLLRQPSLEKQPDLHLHIVIPNEFQPLGKKNIGMTAGIEHSVPPASWIEGVNRMDMTIFTSEYSKKSFDEVEFTKFDNNTQKAIGSLKVEKPSDVLFEGADTNVYKQTKEISNDLKKQFEAADGLIISTPEYNGFFPGLLKNCFDWLSRRTGPEDPILSAFDGKIAGLMAATVGGSGGIRSLTSLTTQLHYLGVTVLPRPFSLTHAGKAFNDNGSLGIEQLTTVDDMVVALLRALRRSD